MTYDQVLKYLKYSPSNYIEVGTDDNVRLDIQIEPNNDGRPRMLGRMEHYNRKELAVIKWETVFKLLMNGELKWRRGFSALLSGNKASEHKWMLYLSKRKRRK